MSRTLDNLKTALDNTRLSSVQRLRIARTKNALTMRDIRADMTLVILHTANGYSVTAVVGSTTFNIARETDAGSAADALRGAPLHHLQLSDFTTPLLALAELLDREAR